MKITGWIMLLQNLKMVLAQNHKTLYCKHSHIYQNLTLISVKSQVRSAVIE